tara:strand:+ start:130 stop:381 length:252 start_codon:yes stop_codon:yes gene_type:complete
MKTSAKSSILGKGHGCAMECKQDPNGFYLARLTKADSANIHELISEWRYRLSRIKKCSIVNKAFLVVFALLYLCIFRQNGAIL